MSYTVINVLTVPEGSGSVLEQRFAGRAATVDTAPGFEHFELLRPVEGTDTYLVYTRWRSKADYEAWTASRAFEEGHRQARAAAGGAAGPSGGPGQGPGHGRPGGSVPAATGSRIWAFEVVQSASAG
ncbi:MAG TPA: antibiotic biosynthesis monooxygenase [Kineosporiaceae bacterium]